MFVGHVGAALAIGRLERRVNIGVFVAASLFLDIVLWFFVLMGWEHVLIPENFAETHQPHFRFPYSHGLIAAVAWSALAAVAAWTAYASLGPLRRRATGLVAVAIFSHWLFDALVHLPELPLSDLDSLKVGLGLWQNISVALAIEAAIVGVGLFLFLSGSRLSRGKPLALIALNLITLIFTVVGMTIAPPPPSGQAMAASSLGVIAILCGSIGWLGTSFHKGESVYMKT